MNQETSLLHVHDLPQLYQKPPFIILLQTLDKLRIRPTSFQDLSHDDQKGPAARIDPDGVPRYLTSIVSSSLSWLEDDTAREQIWDLASTRLSERSGRNAMPSMTRSFTINEDLVFKLFEPSLTEDNLGLKTWTSSLLLARRLSSLRKHVPHSCRRVLELGAGTGLVGLAVGCLWSVDVTLTDLKEIVTNLKFNVGANAHLSERYNSHCTVRDLDWADETFVPETEEEKYQVVVAADPIYTPQHPRILVETVSRWITVSNASRFIVELPTRDGYKGERDDLKTRLLAAGMEMLEDGTETGYDDWQGPDGQPAKVECWWSVWRPVLADSHTTSLQ